MNKIVNRCYACGAKSRSLCPAIGKDICSPCCGSKRGSNINCGSNCTYYPFSIKGYDLWLKIDGSIIKKMLDYIINVRGRNYFEKVMKKMSVDGSPPGHIAETAAGSAAYYILFIEYDKNNQTLGECWKNTGWKGLNNDEQTMINCRLNSRVTVIEIQKILDYQAMECIDILDLKKGTFIVLDRATASRAVRFTRLLVWLTHYPNFSRIENNGVEITDLIYEEYMEIVQKEFKKGFKRKPGFTIKDFLSENFCEFCELSFGIAKEKNIAMLNRIDVHQCRAVYKIQGSFDKIKMILDSYPDFERREKYPEEIDVPGTCYYSWFRRGESKALEKKMNSAFRHDGESNGVGTMGNIVLLPDKIIIEVFTKQKFAFAKKIMKKYFKENIVFQKEMVVDLAKQFVQRIDNESNMGKQAEPIIEAPVKKPETVPIEIERKLMKDFHENHYKKFLDEQIPMLNGQTPRQAAKDPAIRPKLIELMKLHLKGIEKQNKEKKLDLNLDWMLDELNLKELK